jgi:hypothetical protein
MAKPKRDPRVKPKDMGELEGPQDYSLKDIGELPPEPPMTFPLPDGDNVELDRHVRNNLNLAAEDAIMGATEGAQNPKFLQDQMGLWGSSRDPVPPTFTYEEMQAQDPQDAFSSYMSPEIAGRNAIELGVKMPESYPANNGSLPANWPLEEPEPAPPVAQAGSNTQEMLEFLNRKIKRQLEREQLNQRGFGVPPGDFDQY